jgi:FAD/FMN-containing dehydrogenase
LKVATLEKYKSPVALDMMRAIKRALDPQNLFNPGRVVRVNQIWANDHHEI